MGDEKNEIREGGGRERERSRTGYSATLRSARISATGVASNGSRVSGQSSGPERPSGEGNKESRVWEVACAARGLDRACCRRTTQVEIHYSRSFTAPPSHDSTLKGLYTPAPNINWFHNEFKTDSPGHPSYYPNISSSHSSFLIPQMKIRLLVLKLTKKQHCFSLKLHSIFKLQNVH